MTYFARAPYYCTCNILLYTYHIIVHAPYYCTHTIFLCTRHIFDSHVFEPPDAICINISIKIYAIHNFDRNILATTYLLLINDLSKEILTDNPQMFVGITFCTPIEFVFKPKIMSHMSILCHRGIYPYLLSFSHLIISQIDRHLTLQEPTYNQSVFSLTHL